MTTIEDKHGVSGDGGEPPERPPRFPPLVRAVVVVLSVGVPIAAFAFGRAVINGDYFGECDHVAQQQCLVIHVLGVVMHRDASEGSNGETAPTSASEQSAGQKGNEEA